MKRTVSVLRWRTFLAGLATTLVLALAGIAGIALADTDPPPITGLASSTHPSESTWYANPDPAFVWDAATDDGFGVAGYSYEIDREPSTVLDTAVDTTDTTASFTGKADGVWFFHVRAVDNLGNGGAIATCCANIDTAAPSAITGVASSTHPVEATWYANSDPVFSWDAAGDAHSGLAGYSCEIDHAGGTIPDTAVDTSGTTADGTASNFGAKTDYLTGGAPESVAIGDFNGDGKQDLVTANYEAGSVSVLLGDGSGEFGAKADYATGGGAGAVAIGDFNGDGKQDLVTPNEARFVSVLLGDGGGGFGAPGYYAIGPGSKSVAIGEFNGDGKQDLVTANAWSNTVSVLWGYGDGTFHDPRPSSTGLGPASVAVGDFNADGRADLVTANAGANSVSVLLHDDGVGFAAKTDYPTGGAPESVAVGDFNGDGKQDLVTANYEAGSVSVLLGDGSGEFGAHVDFATGPGPKSVAIGDFNGDGKEDLVTANYDAGCVSVLLGDGSGEFGGKADFPTGEDPESVAVGDFNGDGEQDLVTANSWSNTVSVLLSQAPVVLTGMADGIWCFHVRAVDNAGNGGATATRIVRIDTTPPVTADNAGSGSWHPGPFTLRLTPSDDGSGMSGGQATTEYSTDAGSSWQTGTSKVFAVWKRGGGSGSFEVLVRSTDAVGNPETPRAVTVNVDTVAPSTSDDAPAGAHNHDVTVHFTARDPLSGVGETWYRLDDGSWTRGTQVTITTAGNDGTHWIAYYSIDNCGNQETREHRCSVTIDTSGGGSLAPAVTPLPAPTASAPQRALRPVKRHPPLRHQRR
jgi:hypothetical protein